LLILTIRRDANSAPSFHYMTMTTLYDIIPVIPEQLPLLVQLEQQTFIETFGKTHTQENLTIFLQDKKSAGPLAAELAQPGSQYYFLYYEGTPAGFLKVNFGKQPDNGAVLPVPVMELEKIYVLRAFQGKQLGKVLMEYALQLAEAKQVKTVWLGVWEHNTKAYNFYLKQGFERFGEHIFRTGSQEDTDWLMKKHLL
jgi:diamine N-acetyltransferase